MRKSLSGAWNDLAIWHGCQRSVSPRSSCSAALSSGRPTQMMEGCDLKTLKIQKTRGKWQLHQRQDGLLRIDRHVLRLVPGYSMMWVCLCIHCSCSTVMAHVMYIYQYPSCTLSTITMSLLNSRIFFIYNKAAL